MTRSISRGSKQARHLRIKGAVRRDEQFTLCLTIGAGLFKTGAGGEWVTEISCGEEPLRFY